MSKELNHFTEVRFASFLSGGFITAVVVNKSVRALVKSWGDSEFVGKFEVENTFRDYATFI